MPPRRKVRHKPAGPTPLRSGSGRTTTSEATKGYGFIQPDDGGKDAFVHATAIEASGLNGLNEGQRVEFELQKDRRTGKEAAVNLKAVG